MRDSVSFVVDEAGDNVMEWAGEDWGCRGGVLGGCWMMSSKFVVWQEEEGRGCVVSTDFDWLDLFPKAFCRLQV